MDRDPDAWRLVDEGWGRRAAEFASLSQPANSREYVAMHHRLDISDGDRVLDLACGSGFAMELAALRGASVAGIDASDRLIAVARDRVPEGDVRVGDMHALPWDDHSFDVVTSFRGIWGTTPDALAEARRVLVPGGGGVHGLGAHQEVTGRLVALAVPAGQPAEGEEPGQHGGARSAGGRRGAAVPLRVRGRLTDDGSVRLGVPRPRDLRPSAGVHRSGVRSDPDGGRGGVRALGHRDGPRARP